jgi:hypothetical protein
MKMTRFSGPVDDLHTVGDAQALEVVGRRSRMKSTSPEISAATRVGSLLIGV